MTSSIATVLFTDVVDSTALMQRLGDERAQRVFERHHRMLTDTLAASGGEELQWLGDGQSAGHPRGQPRRGRDRRPPGA